MVSPYYHFTTLFREMFPFNLFGGGASSALCAQPTSECHRFILGFRLQLVQLKMQHFLCKQVAWGEPSWCKARKPPWVPCLSLQDSKQRGCAGLGEASGQRLGNCVTSAWSLLLLTLSFILLDTFSSTLEKGEQPTVGGSPVWTQWKVCFLQF